MSLRKLRRIVGRTGLYVVTGSLFLSGGLRVVDGAGEAIAQAVILPAAFANGSQEDAPKPGPMSEVDMAAFDPEGLARLVKTLNDREARIAEREAALEARLSDLKIAEKTLKENLETLRLAEERLASTLSQADGALEADITHLTQVYETMKPKDAAVLFEEMDPKFAAGFLSRMTPAAASGVMAGLAPETAYAISLIFAGRHTGVPTE